MLIYRVRNCLIEVYRGMYDRYLLYSYIDSLENIEYSPLINKRNELSLRKTHWKLKRN